MKKLLCRKEKKIERILEGKGYGGNFLERKYLLRKREIGGGDITHYTLLMTNDTKKNFKYF